MVKIKSVSPDGKLRLEIVRHKKIGETINKLKNNGYLKIKVVK